MLYTGERQLAYGARFAIAGGTVAAYYFLATFLLGPVLALPFQIALVLAFSSAIALHFALQRLFVWRHTAGFALELRHQAARYLAAAGVQYAVTAAATAIVPSRLGVSPFAVYVVVTVVVSTTNFILFQTRIFHSNTITDD